MLYVWFNLHTRVELYANVTLVLFCVLCTSIGYCGCRGRDRMVVGFTTTCAISVYHY
jgi:hypothetical protein